MKEIVSTLDRTKTVIESPRCLIEGHIGKCNHIWCMKAYKKPQYFGISIATWYDKREFEEFDVERCSYGPPYLIPHNSGYGTEFEGFRQANNAMIELAGPWPADLETVRRGDVKFMWTECIEKCIEYNPETRKNEIMERLDVKEFAYYIGPIRNINMQFVDVNGEYNMPGYVKEYVKYWDKLIFA